LLKSSTLKYRKLLKVRQSLSRVLGLRSPLPASRISSTSPPWRTVTPSKSSKETCGASRWGVLQPSFRCQRLPRKAR